MTVKTTFLLVLSTQLMVVSASAARSEQQAPAPPTYYWSRSLPGLLSQRSSHIGPLPHLNALLAEWSPWGAWTKCSRSCDTGVRLRTRHCITVAPRVMPGSGIRTSHDQCGGPSTQYDACGSQPCRNSDLHSGVSFRAAQCRQYDNKKVFGKLVTRWLPYTQGTLNPCALVCEGEGAGIVYTFGKVRDGTHCNAERGVTGVCVNGRCMRVSCDGELGGSALEDRCRVCGGKNTTCTLHKGVFHSPALDQTTDGVRNQHRPQTQTLGLRNLPSDAPQNLRYHSGQPRGQEETMSSTEGFDRDLFVADQPSSVNSKNNRRVGIGYYEVTSIPRGSTNILASDNSHNFLALCEDKKFLLNGDWLIDWPGEVEAGGAIFSYSRAENDSEQLTALGPTKADLSLMILLREDNPGVYYEYWTPNAPANKISVNARKSSQDVGVKRRPASGPPRHRAQFHATSSQNRITFEKSRSSEAKSLSGFNLADESVELPLLSSRRTDAALHSTHRHSARKLSKKRHQIPELFGLESSQRGGALSSRHRSNPTVSSFTADIPLDKKIPQNYKRLSQPRKNPNQIVMDLNAGHMTESIAFLRDKAKKLSKLDAVTYTDSQRDQSSINKQPYHSNNALSNSNSKTRKQSPPVPRNRRPSKKPTHRRRKIRRKKKRRRQKNSVLACPKCSRVREVKKRFCTSDFVSRIEVLDFHRVTKGNTTSRKGRYEVVIHQSFKNTVPLLHKEFLYVENFNCSCPKLQPGKMYLIMGKTHSSGNGREVQLFLDSSSYTRRFTPRILERILKIRNDEMKHCRKWRPLPQIFNVVPNIDDQFSESEHESQPAFAELIDNSVSDENIIRASNPQTDFAQQNTEVSIFYAGKEAVNGDEFAGREGDNLKKIQAVTEADNFLDRNDLEEDERRKWHYDVR